VQGGEARQFISSTAIAVASAADAQRRHAAALAVRLERRQQGREDARAARADRMAERAGAAMDVEPRRIDAEIFCLLHRPAGRGERVVEARRKRVLGGESVLDRHHPHLSGIAERAA